MNLAKFPHLFLALVLIAFFWALPNAFCGDKSEEYKPNDDLVKASFKKAKELGHNPIPMYLEKKGGNIIITGGAMLSIRNGRQAYDENDMVINVGEFPISVADFKLLKGEFAVVRDGKFLKQTGKIISD